MPPDDDDGPAKPGLPLFHLLPENVPAWNAWRALQTQWRSRPDGRHTGLDYAGVEAALRLTVPMRRVRPLFADLRVMERAALTTWNEEP